MGMKSGSLLRLFQSEYFDAHLHMTYLLRMEQSGVQDYLVNELYKMQDDDVDFYLPQLCQVALLRYNTSSLHRFLLDKASRSMHFALRIHWLMQSFVEDKLPELSDSALAMVNACEAAVVNSAMQADGGAAKPGPAGNAESSASMRRSPSCPELRTPDGSTASAGHGALPTDGTEEDAPAGSSRRSCTPPVVQRHPSGCSDADMKRPSAVAGGSSSSTNTGLSHAESLGHLAEMSQAFTAEQKAAVFRLPANFPNAYVELGEPVTGWVASNVTEGTLKGEMRPFVLKQRRCDYFNTQNHLISMITKMSTSLVSIAEKEERKASLASCMNLLNRWLVDRRCFMALNNEGSFSLLGLHIPILRKRDTQQQLLRVHVEQCRVFSSATRAPFLLVYETANLDEAPANYARVPLAKQENGVNGTAEEQAEGRRRRPKPMDVLESDAELLPDILLESLSDAALHELDGIPAGGKVSCAGEDGPSGPEPHRKALRRRLAAVTPEEWLRITAMTPALSAATSSASQVAPVTSENSIKDFDTGGSWSKRAEQAAKMRLKIWGESWSVRKERIREASPFGRHPTWELNGVVVKGGDDLRQELLASQVIKQFSTIFREAGLPLWLYEAEVLVANSSSGFMECFHDTMSVNGMKKHFPGKSLAEIFKAAFADQLFKAKQNFIESYAAYSLVVWFLQVKDRHNDNLLMVNSGHVVHLDFGFMLSNSPGGNIGFESSPFKLTQEFLDIMDGECSDQYEYFRTLVIRGFLEARKHVERIILPVRMLLSGSKLPCFREGPDLVLQSLHDRFYVNLTEAACIEKIVELIDTSVNNWRTIQYDNYQRIVNGIL